MKKLRAILLTAIAAALTAAAGASAAWWGLRTRGAGNESAAPAASAPAADKRPQKYVSLDKVIVMLRRDARDPASHYLAMDLVLKTHEDRERQAKEHLPMLRSVALRALSTYTSESVGAMSVDELAAVVNTAYAEAYAREQRDKPFTEAMISKLVVE